MASALITSRVTRRARSQRPRASSARVIHSRVGTAFVFCRMLAKNVHAIAKSPEERAEEVAVEVVEEVEVAVVAEALFECSS